MRLPGVQIAAGASSWSTITDRLAKKDIEPVNAAAGPGQLAQVPLRPWRYPGEKASATPDLGLTAQNFNTAFYPAQDGDGIGTLQIDGVALAAIRGLNEKVEASSQKSEPCIRELRAENLEFKQTVNELKELVTAMNQKLNGDRQ